MIAFSEKLYQKNVSANDEAKLVNMPQTNTLNLKKLQKFYARVAEITNHMKVMGENNFE